MKEGVLYQVLKELALRYRDGKDPSIFAEIIRKVDGLLRYIVYKAKKSNPYLRDIELQDLYDVAIIGLHKALLKAKEGEPGNKLVYKIVCYTNREIVRWGKLTRRLPHLSDVVMEEKLVDSEPVYKNLELQFVRERFEKLIEDKVISLEEFEMLVMRFVNGMKYEYIAKEVGISGWGASKRIESILNRVRHEFRRRGWGDI